MKETHKYLTVAYAYARANSGCKKVAVGSILVKDKKVIGLGANRALPNFCITKGCLRAEKYGDDSKAHRNPEDCRAIHSEVDAICSAAALGTSTAGADIYVTRYPCEACARAIVSAGIKTVYYGGTTMASVETSKILESGGVELWFVPDWQEDLTDR